MKIDEEKLKKLEEIVKEIVNKVVIDMDKIEESKRKFEEFKKEVLGKIDEYRAEPKKLFEDLKKADHKPDGWIERSVNSFSDVNKVVEYIREMLSSKDYNERKYIFQKTLRNGKVTGFSTGKFVRLTHILSPEVVLPVTYSSITKVIEEKTGLPNLYQESDPDLIIKVSETMLSSFKKLWKPPKELSEEEYALALGYALMEYSDYYRKSKRSEDVSETETEDKSKQEISSENSSVDHSLHDYLRSRGYLFPDHSVAQFYTALKTKGFVILSGLTGSGKTKIALEFAELLKIEIPQLMVASGPDMRAEAEISEIKNTIEELGYAVYGWKPAGKAKDVTLPFILWVYDSNPKDTQYQKVPFGLLVIDRILKSERNLPEDWKEGMKWVERVYEDETVDSYIGYHEIFLKLTKLLDFGESVSQFLDVEKGQKVRSSDMSSGEFLRVKAPEEYNNSIVNHIFLSVRPDWRDSKPLIGWYNPLTEKYEKTELLDLILKATNDKENPYFIILDEMNLAHVEYYFSDFLSVLESGRDEEGFTRESIKLHSINGLTDPPKEVRLPPNLYIIGTVNVDETTYAFSPKVLDRAFTIEFHDVLLDDYPPEAKFGSLDWGTVAKIKEDFTRRGKFLGYAKDELNEAVKTFKEKEYWHILRQLNEALESYDMHFGYRVVDEIAMFFRNALESWKRGIIKFESEDEIFDLAILMKILPKFHGNRKKIEKPLKEVLKRCLAGGVINVDGLDDRNVVEILENWNSRKVEFRFKHTAKKVLRMLRQLYEIGFASFS